MQIVFAKHDCNIIYSAIYTCSFFLKKCISIHIMSKWNAMMHFEFEMLFSVFT